MDDVLVVLYLHVCCPSASALSGGFVLFRIVVYSLVRVAYVRYASKFTLVG